MRRKDREITERELQDTIIKSCEISYLAMSDGNKPYVIPMNFGYDGENIYFHCATSGKKLDLIKNNPQVSIAMTSEYRLSLEGPPNKWTTKYKSIVIEGKAEILTTLEDKQKGINILLQQYADIDVKFDKKVMDSVVIIKVKIDTITGKGNIQ